MPRGRKRRNKEDLEEKLEMPIEQGSTSKNSSSRSENKGKQGEKGSTKKKAKIQHKEEKKRRKENGVDLSEKQTDEVDDHDASLVREGHEFDQEIEAENRVTEIQFQEEDENIIEMRVDASEFPSETEETEDESLDEEQDAQILSDEEFGEVVAKQPVTANQEERGYIYMRNPEFRGTEVNKTGEVEAQQELDREERIVNKTVAKLQEIMRR